jgi:hypothetical protein
VTKRARKNLENNTFCTGIALWLLFSQRPI